MPHTVLLPIPALMQSLAHTRPVFHSEADFQHAFAWEVQKMFPDAQVRLELPVAASGVRMHVDIWIVLDGRCAAIELKYKKRALDVSVGAERFLLTNDGAQDLGRYDFIKDIERLERMADHVPLVEGYAVLLTNDSGYWKESAATVDAAFRLPQGRSLGGVMGWGDKAGSGTTKGREKILSLAGGYTLLWNDYSRLAAPPTLFRWLEIYVPPRN